jgi:hypothetical protein
MAMLNFKELAENILTDLMNNGSISDILLKTKIFASKRGDKELLEWVSKELNGYEDEKPPKYRILNCGLKVDVFVPFRGTARVDFPIDMIEDENVRNRLSNLPFHMSISEIDNLCKDASNDGIIRMKVPVFAYQFLSEFINGDIQDSYQYTTTAAVSQILVAVKSVLIDFLLKVSNEEDINFNTFIKMTPQMITINNNSGIVNTGDGDINAQGATVVTGDNNAIGADNKQELLRILAEIDKIAAAQPNTDYEEVSKDIKAELQKEQPDKKVLRRFFSAIPTFLLGVASSAAGNGVTSLITSALALL